MKVISRKPTAHAAFYWSAAPLGPLALALALLAWRQGSSRLPPGGDPFAPLIIVSLALFVVIALISRAAKVALGKTADEVVDEGEALRVRRGGEEARIALGDIERVYGCGGSHYVLALRAQHPSFGRQIIFWQNPYVRTRGVWPNYPDPKFVMALSERCRIARLSASPTAS